MRRILRTFLLLLPGLLVSVLILWWPIRPLWTFPAQPGKTIYTVGFSKCHGALLVYARPDPPTRPGPVYSTMLVLNSQSGRLEHSWELLFVHDQTTVFPSKVLPPGDRLLVDSVEETISYRRHHRIEIVDMLNGQTLVGPVRSAGSSHISPDGQWIWSPGRDDRWIRIISSQTGQTIASIFGPERNFTEETRFSHDSRSVAVLWFGESGQRELHIFALPSGRRLFQAVIPLAQRIDQFYQWNDANFSLRMTCHHPTFHTYHYCSLEIEDGLVKSNRVLTARQSQETQKDKTIQYEFFKHVGTRLMLMQFRHAQPRPQWVNTLLKWLDQKLGTSWRHQQSQVVTLRVFDASSRRLLQEFISDSLNQYSLFSPDGRQVTTIHPQRGLQVWDLDPIPRWHWALAWSLFWVVLVLFLGRTWPALLTRFRLYTARFHTSHPSS